MGTVQHATLFSARNLRTERGDTIVEVLISLVVIATIITGGFVLSRTSSKDIRTSQEHGEALALLQGQVELLRAGITANSFVTPWVEPAVGSDFCMNPTTGKPVLFSSGTTCKVSNTSSAYTYDLKIRNDNSSVASTTAQNAQYGNTYTATVSWDSLNGGTNQESLVYRVAKPAP